MELNQSQISSSSSVHQSLADDVSLGFNHLQIHTISDNQTSIHRDMDVNQQIISSSSSAAVYDDDLHRDADDSVHQSASDDVSLGFNHLQIDRNDDPNSKNLVKETSETDESAADEVSFGLNHLQVEHNHDSVISIHQSESDEVSFGFNHLQIETDDDDGDFTFACVNDNDSPTTDDSFKTGQIRNVFPLFDQSLLSNTDLPINVPVDNVFIESPQPFKHKQTDSTIHALSKQSEIKNKNNIKSNSTGFSKLWRFRNEMNRSNSDGRDAFVFLEASATSSESKPNAVNVDVKGKGVKKVKKSTASAHEVYMKQKGQSEEDKRRSYLPYRPGLMGFFTNVNGGLSKNVHPF